MSERATAGREWAARAALATAAVLATLALAEIAVRLLPASPRFLRAEEIWRAQQIDPGEALMRDGLERGGVTFRDHALPEAAFAPKARRLLFLGDSFTVGWGLAERSERFTDVVEARLRGSSMPELHVFNAARGGTNPEHWERYLRILWPEVKPDAVVAVFFLRDGTRLGTSLQLNRREIDPIYERTIARPLYGRSALLTWFWDRRAWIEYTRGFNARLRAAYLGSHAEREMWRLQQTALLAMASRCEEAGVPFHLVVFPLLFDLHDYGFHDVEGEIEQFAEQSDIPHFSLTPAFLGREDHTLWVASNDQHPNARGHAIAAERLLPYVRDVVLSESAGLRSKR